MYTDTIADYLTRIRNASMAGHKVVDIPSSNIKKDITKIIFEIKDPVFPIIDLPGSKIIFVLFLVRNFFIARLYFL